MSGEPTNLVALDRHAIGVLEYSISQSLCSCLSKNSLNMIFLIVYSYIMDTTAKRLQFSQRCPRLSSYLSSRLYW